MLRWVVADKAMHRKLLYGQFLCKMSKMCHYEQTNSDCHLGKQTKVWKPEQDITLEVQVQCSLLAENPVIVEPPLTSMVLCLSNHEMSIHKMISELYLCITVQQSPETVEPQCQGTDLSKCYLPIAPSYLHMTLSITYLAS